MAPEETIYAQPRHSPADVAALAEDLRRRVTPPSRWHETSGTTVEGRFLRRLWGALSAYEAAHGILTPDGRRDRRAVGGRRPLARQSCPSCGASEFEAVGASDVIRLVCRRCRSCSEPCNGSLVLAHAGACPGCDLGLDCS